MTYKLESLDSIHNFDRISQQWNIITKTLKLKKNWRKNSKNELDNCDKDIFFNDNMTICLDVTFSSVNTYQKHIAV